MKTLALAAILAALGTSAYADHGWNNGNSNGAMCGGGNSSYGRSSYSAAGRNYGTSYGYGRTSYSAGDLGYFPNNNSGWNEYSSNHGFGYGTNFKSGNGNSCSSRSSLPAHAPYASDHTYYDDYRSRPYSGFPRTYPYSSFEAWPSGYFRN